MNNIHSYIDQTLLRPDATLDDVMEFLVEVEAHNFFAAVVNPCWVELVRRSVPARTKVCSVVGFPLGATTIEEKRFACEDLVSKGCDEIDMVMNIGKFKDKDYAYIADEIGQVVASAQGRIVKVIIETCLLTNNEKQAAAEIIMKNGAHFVKTSTGFSSKGATEADVRLLRNAVGPGFGVKASGGIRDYEQAVALINAGANRLGTSAGPQIVRSQNR